MIEVHLERDIHELDFEYNAKMEGYTNLTSDIPKLGEIFRLPGQSRQAKIIQTCRLRLTNTKRRKRNVPDCYATLYNNS